MSDPRLDDPRLNTRLNDPVLQRNERAASGTTWAWIGGLAAVILIAILVLGNWHTGTDSGTPVTANTPAATTPGTPPASLNPPSTTGSGTTSPAAPARPAPPAAPAQ